MRLFLLTVVCALKGVHVMRRWGLSTCKEMTLELRSEWQDTASHLGKSRGPSG